MEIQFTGEILATAIPAVAGTKYRKGNDWRTRPVVGFAEAREAVVERYHREAGCLRKRADIDICPSIVAADSHGSPATPDSFQKFGFRDHPGTPSYTRRSKSCQAPPGENRSPFIT